MIDFCSQMEKSTILHNTVRNTNESFNRIGDSNLKVTKT
jgi:hypothetical protein